MSLESKKILILRIYQILSEYSDAEHPLTHKRILEILYRDYGAEAERKAVGRNIAYLAEAGIDIVSTRQGCYIADKVFEEGELRLLIDSVLCNRHVNELHSKNLITKLVKMGGRNFKSRVKHVYALPDWSKSENKAFFYNIETVDEAIERNSQITFAYNKYGVDKKLHARARHRVSPYQMVLRNQHYFLLCYEEYWKNITFFRMDKITDIALTDKPRTPIREIKGYENGINYKELALSRPYMFPDKPEKTEILCPEWFIDEIIDWFGKEISVKPAEGESILVTLSASPKAMEYWAMQYADYAEVLSPRHLRERIKEKIVAAAGKYYSK